jgi:hypothetical protein
MSQRCRSVRDRSSPHRLVLCAVHCTAADRSRLGGSVGDFVAAVAEPCDRDCAGGSVAVLPWNAAACVDVHILTADCVPYNAPPPIARVLEAVSAVLSSLSLSHAFAVVFAAVPLLVQ